MGSLSNESFEQFLDSLKKAGITISNETELRERLAEAEAKARSEAAAKAAAEIVNFKALMIFCPPVSDDTDFSPERRIAARPLRSAERR